MKKFLGVIAAALLFSGCVTWQVPGPAVNYGEAPTGFESKIPAYMENVLKDPVSAQYKYSTPVRAYTNFGWGESGGGNVEWTGYVVKMNVNAKNSYGGYTGYRPYLVLFKDNAVFRVIPGSEHPLVHEVR